MHKLKTPAATPTKIPERIGPWPTLLHNKVAKKVRKNPLKPGVIQSDRPN
jgi:hypothetical protein